MVKNGQDSGNILKEDLMALLVSLDEEWLCVVMMVVVRWRGGTGKESRMPPGSLA